MLEPPHELTLDEPGLAACYAAAAQGISVSGERAGQPPLRLITSTDPPERAPASDATDQPIAEVRGVNVHAAQIADAIIGSHPRVGTRACGVPG